MRVRSFAALVALLVLIPVGQASAKNAHKGGELHQYAERTWASFAAMTDPRSGLPADILNSDGTTSVQTSTTNIAAYMWSAVAAERIGLISKRELAARM